MLGSGQIVSALAQSRLLDEYWLFVAHVVLGSGRPLFQDVQERVQFKLVETQSLRSGVVLLRAFGKDFRLFMDWKGNHHEISSHLGWHQQHQYP